MKRVGKEGDCQGKVDSLFSAGKRREGIFAGKRREEKRQGIIDRRDNLREPNGQLPADSCDTLLLHKLTVSSKLE